MAMSPLALYLGPGIDAYLQVTALLLGDNPGEEPLFRPNQNAVHWTQMVGDEVGHSPRPISGTAVLAQFSWAPSKAACGSAERQGGDTCLTWAR